MAFTQIRIPPIKNEKHTANGWIEGRNVFRDAKPHSQILSDLIGCSHLSQPFACMEAKYVA